jgi:hypothetical protein
MQGLSCSYPYRTNVSIELTPIGLFPRTTAALVILSDIHILGNDPILATAASSRQMRSWRTAALNLLRVAGYPSICAGKQSVMHDIGQLLAMARR